MFSSKKIVKKAIEKINKLQKREIAKQLILRNLDLFVLDNSIRESTVGQMKEHTLRDKWEIFREVKKCGYQYIVVAAFSDQQRVDDIFVRELVESGEDMSCLFSFVDFIENNNDGHVNMKTVPNTMRKMEKLGLKNPIIEIDLVNSRIENFDNNEVCQLLQTRFEWIKENLSLNSKIFVNFRDFPIAMSKYPSRLLNVVKFIGSLSESIRPIGLMYEDASGNLLPEDMAIWTKSIRQVMNSVRWREGHLLVHVHEQWGLAESVQLKCLTAGANGVWASLCEEGAAFGHACSSITLMNLVRLGNSKVLEKFNCKYLRQAAIEVTKITTGDSPHPKQCLYGERVLDLCFDFDGIAGGNNTENEFDMATFFCIDKPIRINTLASNDMLLKHMRILFGHNSEFTEDVVGVMKQKMVVDLLENRKEEYTSPVGLALLFYRAGGNLNARMRDVIDTWEINTPQVRIIGNQLRAIWDELDLTEEIFQQRDNALEFETFFRGFMQPFFSSIDCEESKKAMKALDMDNDGKVEWSEFMVYVKWAMYQNPYVCDKDELLSIAFNKGLIPAILDEIIT